MHQCKILLNDKTFVPQSQLEVMVRNRLTVESRSKPDQGMPTRHFFAFVKPNATTEVGHLDFRTYANGEGFIVNFVVRENYRKFGIGRKILTAVLEDKTLPRDVKLFARPVAGAVNALVQTNLEKYYNSFGFKQTGYVSRHGVEMVLHRKSI